MKNKITKKYLFGWTNIKWGIKELIKVYSGQKSFFSKKRLESGVAFLIAQWGMIFFLLENIIKMTSSDLAIWAGIEFLIAGYNVYQIEKGKKANQITKSLEESEDV